MGISRGELEGLKIHRGIGGWGTGGVWEGLAELGYLEAWGILSPTPQNQASPHPQMNKPPHPSPYQDFIDPRQLANADNSLSLKLFAVLIFSGLGAGGGYLGIERELGGLI